MIKEEITRVKDKCDILKEVIHTIGKINFIIIGSNSSGFSIEKSEITCFECVERNL